MAERREMEEKRNIEAEIKMIFGSAEPLDWLKEYQQKTEEKVYTPPEEHYTPHNNEMYGPQF